MVRPEASSMLPRLSRLYAVAMIALFGTLAACGGGGGSETTANAGSNNNPTQNDDQNEIAAFAGSLHVVLAANCASCHGDSGPNLKFAQTNVAAAYDIVIDHQLADLSNPSGSELVRKLVVDQHNCWSDCVANGNELAQAIGQWQILSTASGNALPVAKNDRYTTAVDTKLVITNALENDFDPDGNVLRVLAVDATTAANGSVTINGDNTLDYMPLAGFVGDDSFTYTVSDGQGGTAQATVTVTVTGASDNTSSAAAFEKTVFTLVRAHCAACHSGGLQQELPLFAAADISVAHEAVLSEKLVNFGNAANSPLVERLIDDKHFCWTKDCQADGLEMETQIEAWAELIGR